jgi:predicted nucleic acid-binding protein
LIIFDASSLLNLHNGGLVPTVLALPGLRLAYGPQVRQECKSIGQALDALVATGSADLLNDDDVPFARFADLSEKYQLGPGETECLVLAERLHCAVSCDDLRARRMIGAEIGRGQLTGTIGLIQAAVAEGLITEGEARAAHSKMIAAGAFLPKLVLTLGATGAAVR